MKRKLLLTLALTIGISIMSIAQFTTGTVTLTTGFTVKIDTNPTTVTLTMTGPSNTWLGIGFNGFSMAEVTDMFIWNASANRDYMAPGGHFTPSPDPAGSQSWTSSDSVSGTTRTVIATRALVSAGDYTFLNDNSNINIIFALSNSTTLSQHTGVHSVQTLTRSALGIEDFSLKSSSIFPNPSNGSFNIKTKTYLTKINVYTQTGTLVKTIDITDSLETSEINIKGLQLGVYLLELQNDTEKTWRKIIVN